MLLSQITSIIGAILILVAYFLLQSNLTHGKSRTFLSMNSVGGILLTYSAFATGNYGFIMLEGSWALISLVSLIRTFL